MDERTLRRPRRVVVTAWLGYGLIAVPAWVVAALRRGGVRLVAGAGALLLSVVLPVAFLYGSRVRTLTFGPAGIQLSGFRLNVHVSWPDVAAVDFRTIGPTTFLVVRTAGGRRLPALSPFRRLFARELGVPDPRSLLVVRTVDFSGGYPAVDESIRSCAPASVAIRP